jgi:chromosome segregation protein
LDEANNERFNRIVGDFLDKSQFLIITHSKRTMSIADVLYGVTMQEAGVSRRVSVKFDSHESDGKAAVA